MTTTTPLQDIDAILEKTKPRPPGKCHTIDHRGYAVCGAFRCAMDERGGLHSRRECRQQRHRHCVICDELGRQLGDDGMVA